MYKIKEKNISENVLVSQLQERYNAMQNLRDRVQTISLRILWILLWISWWLAQWEKINFNCCERISAILILIILCVIFICYFNSLKRGWLFQHEIAVKIEKKLWLYNNILPWDYKENKKRPFLNSHYWLLWFWVVVLLISILYFT